MLVRPKRRRPRLWFVLATIGAIAVTLTVAARVTAARSGLALIGEPQIEVTFTAKEGYESASFTVTVRNSTGEGAPLTVGFLPSGVTGRPIEASAAPPDPLTALVLIQSGAALALPAGEAASIALELRRPIDSDEGSGVVVLGLAGRPTAGATVSITEAAADAAKTGFEQKTVTLVATAWVGPVSRVCHTVLGWSLCPGQHFSGTSTTVRAAGVVERTTPIMSSNGSQLTLVLEPAEDATTTSQSTTSQTTTSPTTTGSTTEATPSPPNPTLTTTDPAAATFPAATITATEIPRPGKYSGDLAIDPTAKEPQTTAVTVDVQDAVYWPLLVVLLGAALGGVLTRVYDHYRSRNLLRASLQESVIPYLKERETPDKLRPQRFFLDDLLAAGGPEQNFSRPRLGRGSEPEKPVPKLFWRIGGLKSSDELSAFATEMKTTTDRFARWAQLNAAFDALDDSLGDLPNGLPVAVDGERLLDLAEDEPIDDAETAKRVQRMQGHARLIVIYRAVRDRFEKQSTNWQARNPDVDPQKIYAAAAPVDSRTPDQATTLRLDLVRAYRLLAEPELLTPQTWGADPSLKRLRLAYHDRLQRAQVTTDAEEELSSLVIPDLGRIASVFSERLRVYQPPEEIRAVVREWDWAVFWLLAILTALVYLLPTYTGKDFGSLTDYLGAFAAGATVPTVVNWALSPLARSTKVSGTSGDAKTAAA